MRPWNNAAEVAGKIFAALVKDQAFQSMTVGATSVNDARLGPSIVFRVGDEIAEAEISIAKFTLEECPASDLIGRIPWQLRFNLERKMKSQRVPGAPDNSRTTAASDSGPADRA